MEDDVVSQKDKRSGAAEQLGCGHSLPIGCKAFSGQRGSCCQALPTTQSSLSHLELSQPAGPG